MRRGDLGVSRVREYRATSTATLASGQSKTVTIGAFTVQANNIGGTCSSVKLNDQNNPASYFYMPTTDGITTPTQVGPNDPITTFVVNTFSAAIPNSEALNVAPAGGGTQFLAALSTGKSAIDGTVGAVQTSTGCLTVGNIVGQ